MAEEEGLEGVDKEQFNACMAAQVERSRGAAKDDSLKVVLIAEHTSKLKEDGIPQTQQSSKYEWHIQPQATLQAIVQKTSDKVTFVDSIAEGSSDTYGLIFDLSSFYATAGGQVCDTGSITFGSGMKFVVVKTESFAGYVLHIGKPASGSVNIGEKASLEVDYERRALIAPNHTMTHVLNYALRKVLIKQDPPADQRGSHNDTEKLRFDFNSPKGLTPVQLEEIQAIVNKAISASLEIHTTSIEFVTAKQITSLRCMFSETYPKIVRLVTIGETAETMLKDPTSAEWMNFSVELCGGTHITNTAQAQQFAILEETSIAAGTRRIVAVTREAAASAFENLAIVEGMITEATAVKGPTKQAALKNVQKFLKKTLVPAGKKKMLGEQLKQMTKAAIKEAKAYQKKMAAEAMVKAESLAAAAKTPCVVLDLPGIDGKTAGKVLDKLTKKEPTKAFIVMSHDAGANNFLCFARSGNDFDAKAAVEAICAIGGGKGGGKPTKAQGKGKDGSKYADALKEAQKLAA